MDASTPRSDWRTLTQEELDRAYTQASYAANREQLLSRYRTRSEVTRRLRGEPERRAYGDTEIEKLDIYAARAAGAPVNVFIHGGAWRIGSASECGLFAELFNDAGAHYVVPDFTDVESAEGDLGAMVAQVRRALAWTWRHAPEFGGDRERIYVSGTSSGAHLAAAALTSHGSDHGLPDDAFRGALLCSGIYDLEPVSRSARSKYVRFTEQSIGELSPLRNLDRMKTPAVVVFGSLETPEFKRQSREFADALSQRGLLSELIVAEGYNHFEIHETLGDPYDVLGRAVLSQMRLRTP
jgi:arylformamidase